MVEITMKYICIKIYPPQPQHGIYRPVEWFDETEVEIHTFTNAPKCVCVCCFPCHDTLNPPTIVIIRNVLSNGFVGKFFRRMTGRNKQDATFKECDVVKHVFIGPREFKPTTKKNNLMRFSTEY